MSGRALVIGLLAFAVLFGAGLWYAQVYAYYDRVDGLDAVLIGGVAVPVSDYRGLDGASSPLKLRGCFRLDPAAVIAPDAPNPAPLSTPGWFDCFDPEAIAADIAAGRARAVIAAENEPAGFIRIVAFRPDGRAFQWRQTELD
ncbi:MAG: DUF6446 family protein [Rubrimonas sp.]|uniref:DUF6446 family protein n=1 Tax=Rubrimonas sp. TaxID=2036015 RepID=UPI002FDDF3CE